MLVRVLAVLALALELVQVLAPALEPVLALALEPGQVQVQALEPELEPVLHSQQKPKH